MSESAMKRCSLGALLMAAYEITKDHRAAYDLAIRAMQPLHGSATLMHVNGSRGHAAVLALFDELSGRVGRGSSSRCTFPMRGPREGIGASGTSHWSQTSGCLILR
jgi:hypothetical protein